MAAGSRDAVRSMIAEAGQSAEAAHLTKSAVLLAASQYRNLPPHNADATEADQAYRCASPPHRLTPAETALIPPCYTIYPYPTRHLAI